MFDHHGECVSFVVPFADPRNFNHGVDKTKKGCEPRFNRMKCAIFFEYAMDFRQNQFKVLWQLGQVPLATSLAA